MRTIALIFTLFLFVSCAKTTDEKVAEAIDVANSYLSDGKCDSAINVLEEVGRQSDNGIYLQVLASAYACRAGFSELTFLLNDLDVLTQATTGTSNVLNYLSILSSSVEDQTDSDSYTDLKTAINLLIDSTGAAPSQTARETKFGPRRAGDMGMQALLMMFAQLGKFVHYYGNVNPNTGAKGGGSVPNDNNCFIAYSDATATAILGTGTCSTGGSKTGHIDLSLAPASLTATKLKLCEGLMLFTNIKDTINELDIPAGSTLSALDSVKTSLSSITSFANSYPQLNTLLGTTDQATCESLVSSGTEFSNLQIIYAGVFEKGLL